MAATTTPDRSRLGRTTSVFDDLLSRGIRSGQVPARTQEAIKWFRERAKRVRNISAEEIIQEEKFKLKPRVELGHLYLWHYDAKHKATLPYWDSFPCSFIIPSDMPKRYFNAINLHYLPPVLRAKFMDRLYEHLSNTKFDESTKLKLVYEDLKAIGNFYKPCYNTYLRSRVKSRFVKLNVNEWDIALFLPIAKWNNDTQDKVWRDSRKMAKG